MQTGPGPLDEACTWLEQGRPAQAEALLRQALAKNPNQFEALHLLAVAAAQQGKADEARALFASAIEQNPRSSLVHANLGLLLHETGQHEAALASYDRALSIKPGDPATHYRRGIVLQALRRLDEALASYEQALAANPKFVEALNNRGNVLNALGRPDEALASFDKALAINPRLPEALNNRGSALQALGRLDAALASFDKALEVRPRYVEALNNRGNALRDLGRSAEALEAYERALVIAPGDAETHFRRGILFGTLGRFEDAIASYERAVANKPDHVEALYNRGNALLALGRNDEAIASFERALAVKPDHPGALNNRGAVLQALNRHEDAIANYDRALAIRPNDAGIHFNASLARLTVGGFPAGWEEYEWRWKTKDFIPHHRKFSQPLWLGKESLEGKAILLHAEQGFGDCIQFIRYASAVAGRGARVVLEVPAALRTLVDGFAGVERVVTKGEALPDFDLHCPLMSLPLAMGTTLQSIPSEVPYLRAPADKLNAWSDRLGPATRPRVGIVWSGRPTQRNDRNRSIPLSEMLALVDTGVEIVSLQKELRSDEQAMLLNRAGIRHFGDELKDFSDTAALASLMDLVVSVDTSVAHLSGALARPLWILLAFRSDWRWLLDREDSPWYPTAKLFRQPALGDWESVVRRVERALRDRFRQPAADRL